MFSNGLDIMSFMVIFSILVLLSIFILKFLSINATALRKSWNLYVTMLILHCIFFFGIQIFLPSTLPSMDFDYNEEIKKVETIQDLKSILREQRREINEIKDSSNTIRNILWVFTLISILLLPTIYYNLIKSNLEIERLSGKRMGSLD